MLLRDVLIAEYSELIDKIVKATTLPKNEESRDKVATTIVRSMGMSNSKEPSHCPIYILSEALSGYQKSGAWPAKFPEFIEELSGLTELPYSTVRSSISKFPWDIPSYLKPKTQTAKAERVTVTKPYEGAYLPLKVSTEQPKIPPPIKEDIVKLKEDYHVVIDFGAFKITIERVKHEDDKNHD